MADFENNSVMNVSMKIGLDLNGNIAQSGDTIAAKKRVSIAGIKKNATLAEANTVFSVFYGQIADATFDSLSAVRTISEGVGT